MHQHDDAKKDPMAAPLEDALVQIDTGINEDDQEGGFMNSTLQNAGEKLAMSIQTHLVVPPCIADGGEEAVALWIKGMLCMAAKAVPGLTFNVQVGPARNSDD